MAKVSGQHMVLALEIRAHRFGFGALEKSSRLVDWGIKILPTSIPLPPTVKSRLGPILTQFSPSIVVARRLSQSRLRGNPSWSYVIRLVRKEIENRSIPFAPIGNREVLRVFAELGSTTKFGIASTIARMYPEIGWRLPPARRPWQPEDYNALLFDAVAVGTAYLARFQRDTNGFPSVPNYQA